MIHKTRLKILQELMAESQTNAIALNAGIDLTFFTGLTFHLSERPVIFIAPRVGNPALIFPELEKGKVLRSNTDLELFPYQENPIFWPDVARQALQALDLPDQSIAVSPLSFRFLEVQLLQTASSRCNFYSAEEILKHVYVIKDQQAIKCIQKAVEIAETALNMLLPTIKIGKTEKEIANQLIINLLATGSDPDLPFSPIVASGPNSADPHAIPGDRKLQAGDLLIIDWGARYDGYVSDITRTFIMGKMDEQYVKIADIVHQANQSARKMIKPGITASQIDAAARGKIEESGFGDRFIHRTGHGIGLREHEDPYISSTDHTVLAEGMVFTIEPGIYLPEMGGVRIEDDVLVTSNGEKPLTNLPRDLICL